jgi:hypothetical protein
VAAVVNAARWDHADVADFLGRFLPRPKPGARFAPWSGPLEGAAFGNIIGGRAGRRPRRQLTLALPTRGLLRRGRLFLNGEAYAPPRQALPALRTLLLERALALPLPRALAAGAMADLLRTWMAAGYLRVA